MIFRITLLIISLLYSFEVWAQSPAFQWAHGMGGEDSDRGYAIITDDEGNIYTTGFFRDQVDFDPSPRNTELLTAIGSNDIFLQKMTDKGELEWVRQMGGNGFGYALALDEDGNIYMTGSFSDGEPMDFSPGSPGDVLNANGIIDVFMLKLDPSGNLIWVMQIGGTGYDNGLDVKIDKDGNPIFLGTFENTIDLDPGPDMMNVTSNGDSDFFVVKLDPDGNLIWEDHFGGLGYDWASAIDIDSNSNILITGSFSETVDFDPGRGVESLISAGGSDLFLLKLDENGSLVWVKGIHNNQECGGLSLAADRNDNIYLASYFEGTVDFDPGPGINRLEAFDAVDCAIQKFSSDGEMEWLQHWGGSGWIFTQDMSTDPQGNVLLTGYFEESVALNPHPARKFILSEGSFDMFILGLKPDGQALWATGQGGHGPDGASSIATDNVGGIYTTGYFFGVMDADPGIGSDILQSNGLEDIFIGKWQGMTVSVKEALSSDMTLYPNPGTGPYIIELSEAVNGTLTIYDAFGKSVQQLSVNGNEILLKVELAPGTYWIMIESERRQTYTQLVIP